MLTEQTRLTFNRSPPYPLAQHKVKMVFYILLRDQERQREPTIFPTGRLGFHCGI